MAFNQSAPKLTVKINCCNRKIFCVHILSFRKVFLTKRYRDKIGRLSDEKRLLDSTYI